MHAALQKQSRRSSLKADPRQAQFGSKHRACPVCACCQQAGRALAPAEASLVLHDPCPDTSPHSAALTACSRSQSQTSEEHDWATRIFKWCRAALQRTRNPRSTTLAVLRGRWLRERAGAEEMGGPRSRCKAGPTAPRTALAACRPSPKLKHSCF